jgi:glycosyltransferase involved in cell wall biosynthesis
MNGSLSAAQPYSPNFEGSPPEVSIIIPARNEETSLGDCLQSLITQTGVAFEIIVVDDDSTDRTREIAQSFAGVKVISPGPLPAGWTGKNNAVVAGAKEARTNWLLFTDADTVHMSGSLARALVEAKKERADLLSYSPHQVVATFAERAVMPVVFAELAVQYPPHRVCEENSKVVAANGQYILVRRAAYDAVGGHTALATEILEDVALARLFRNAGLRVYFRYGAGSVCTRMYRNWAQLREGWTKNLALLFPQSKFLAYQSLLLWLAAWATFGFAIDGASNHHYVWIAFAIFWLPVYLRINIAHFAAANNLMALAFGLPMFVYLLLRSRKAHASGHVSWKGRDYTVGTKSEKITAKLQATKPIPRIEDQKLRTGN